jgi:hypothetical protein
LQRPDIAHELRSHLLSGIHEPTKARVGLAPIHGGDATGLPAGAHGSGGDGVSL